MRIIVLMLAIALTSACSVLSESKTAEVTPQETPRLSRKLLSTTFAGLPMHQKVSCELRCQVLGEFVVRC